MMFKELGKGVGIDLLNGSLRGKVVGEWDKGVCLGNIISEWDEGVCLRNIIWDERVCFENIISEWDEDICQEILYGMKVFVLEILLVNGIKYGLGNGVVSVKEID